MQKNHYKIVLMLMVMGIFSACSSDKEDNNSESGSADSVLDLTTPVQSIQLTDEQRSFVKKNNDFTFNLFRAINNNGQSGKSFITSPLSVTFLMGMLNDGSQGNTAEEIANVLGFGKGDKTAINAFCKALIEQAPVQDPMVKLQIANIVATNNDVKLEDAFQQDMKESYKAEVASLDFSQKSSLDYLNGWCNEKSNGMIPSIIDQLSPADKLVLMNAVYFKATWTYYFEKAATRNEPFTLRDGSTRNVPMMQRKAILSYGKNDTYATIRLPFGASLWNMDILLPEQGKTIDDVIMSLNANNWNHSLSRHIVKADIHLPRFSTTSDIQLNKMISDLGAPSMFSPETADFSLISKNTKNLWVGVMKQKTAINVNEEGAETSAVTAAHLVSGTGEIKMEELSFHANQPFVYIISESTSGTIFFVGTYQGD